MDQRCADQSSAIFYRLPILQRHNNPRGIRSPLSKCQFTVVGNKSSNEGAAGTVYMSVNPGRIENHVLRLHHTAREYAYQQ